MMWYFIGLMIGYFIFFVLIGVAHAGPNSIPPVEIQLQKIQVRPAEPYDPSQFMEPQSFKTEQEAVEYKAKHGGMVVRNSVLGRWDVIGIKENKYD